MSSVYTRFPCGPPDGRITLEGELYLPQGRGPFPGVVVCHPHPLYGGDMMNNVVSAICRALPQHSVAAFRFNFRGVGSSGGTFGGGIAEQTDIKAALDFVLSMPDIDAQKTGLVGYSFGATVALPVALADERVSCLALVSPSLSDAAWEQLKGYHKPKLLIVGDADSLLQREQFQQHIKDMADSEQYQVVAGVDHFWRGQERELAEKVTRFLVTAFSQG